MKVAIVKLSAMGDIIHAMVALQYIKEAQPNIQIDWIVEEVFTDILKHNPHIDNILPVNLKAIKKDKKALTSEIKKIKTYTKNEYDLVIDAQGLIKSAITSKLLGRNIAGFSKDSIREGVASYFYKHKVSIGYGENAIERNVKVLTEPLNIKVTKEDILNKVPLLYFEPNHELPISIANYVVFVVGASVSNKIYPRASFLEVAKTLDEKILVVWGNNYEYEVASFLSKELENVVISPKLTLDELKRVIAESKLVIGGDTGPTHIAWALNIPSLTIFGNTPEKRNTYITNINKVIKSNSLVNPLKLDKGDFSIKEIEPQTIVTLAKELLDA
jgi:heptosyltransferase-1